MSVVNVKVNGRSYQVACDNGQEDHLLALAEDINERVGALIFGMKNRPGEGTALVLAALTMADELTEKQKEIDKLAADIKRLRSMVAEESLASQDGRVAEMEAAMASTLDEIAARIEKIADQVEIR